MKALIKTMVAIIALASCALLLFAWIISPPRFSTLLGQSPLTTSPLMACIPVQEWVTYTNTTMAFTIKYPQDVVAMLPQGESSNTLAFTLRPHCNDMNCNQLLGVTIRQVDNSKRLTAEDYVTQKIIGNGTGTPWSISAITWFINGGRFIRIAGERALRLDGSSTDAQIAKAATQFMPTVYIPHNDILLIVETTRGGKSTMPPFVAPCSDQMSTLDQMLKSLQFSPHP